MKTTSKILAATFVLLFANHSFAQANATATANTTAIIVTPIKITCVYHLQFGHIAIHATNGGTVTMPDDGTARTFTGGVTLPATTGALSPASFTVEGDGNRSFIITLPSNASLNDGAGHTMTVDHFSSNL